MKEQSASKAVQPAKTGLDRDRVTVLTLRKMKAEGIPAAALSIYDYPFARLAAKANADMIIVGDSLGMTVLGYQNTLPVTMEEMMVFIQAAVRGAGPMFVVGDLPLGAYQSSDAQGVDSAVKFIKAGCTAVKCEASMNLISRIEAIANAEILVMGHIGLNPQKIHEMGGHRIQGKTIDSTRELLRTAKALENAGAFALLLEGITEEVAGLIREELTIPVYGIASGRYVDGQLLIGHDPLGLYDWGSRPVPKYIKQYKPVTDGTKNIMELMLDGFTNYVNEVKSRKFPLDENVHHLNLDDLKKAKGSEAKEAQQILKMLQKSAKTHGSR
jgi:3-methyl-2-oxobutanoate hydroxymethyltransferase